MYLNDTKQNTALKHNFEYLWKYVRDFKELTIRQRIARNFFWTIIVGALNVGVFAASFILCEGFIPFQHVLLKFENNYELAIVSNVCSKGLLISLMVWCANLFLEEMYVDDKTIWKYISIATIFVSLIGLFGTVLF